jgi:hypothetical protein
VVLCSAVTAASRLPTDATCARGRPARGRRTKNGAPDPDSAIIFKLKKKSSPIQPPAKFKQDPTTATTAILDSHMDVKKSEIAVVTMAARAEVKPADT